jgi:pyridoxine 5-phosphate synthase
MSTSGHAFGAASDATSAATATALSVNLNKVALVRNTRHLGIPSVVKAAEACLGAGAKGITVHPRPDARHIRAHDVSDLSHCSPRTGRPSSSTSKATRSRT